MKTTFAFLIVLIATNAMASAPARKAVVSCPFKIGMLPDGKTEKFEDGFLAYEINLDSKNVKVSCKKGSETCLLDGSENNHQMAVVKDKTASFEPIKKPTPRGDNHVIYANMPALNIEGGNGDDMDMFTRITFYTDRGPKDVWELVGTAVLIYADEGNDGIVTPPTACSVKILK